MKKSYINLNYQAKVKEVKALSIRKIMNLRKGCSYEDNSLVYKLTLFQKFLLLRKI